MRILIVCTLILISSGSVAQNAVTSNFVEGGKTLVELIRVFRAPRSGTVPANYVYTDSCGAKKLADISFMNKTSKTIFVSLFLRIGNGYAVEPLQLKLSPQTQESLFEIKTGIYKYRIESAEGGERTVVHEGELRLQPCDKLVREIKG